MRAPKPAPSPLPARALGGRLDPSLAFQLLWRTPGREPEPEELGDLATVVALVAEADAGGALGALTVADPAVHLNYALANHLASSPLTPSSVLDAVLDAALASPDRYRSTFAALDDRRYLRTNCPGAELQARFRAAREAHAALVMAGHVNAPSNAGEAWAAFVSSVLALSKLPGSHQQLVAELLKAGSTFAEARSALRALAG